MTSKLILFAVLVLGFALGYASKTCDEIEETPLPFASCQRVCSMSVRFLAFVNPALNTAFRLATLIPKTDLACERICLASGVAEEFAKGLLKDEPLISE